MDRTLSDDPPINVRVDISRDDGQTLTMSWVAMDQPVQEIRDIVIVTSLDGGHDWSLAHFLHHDNWEINICPEIVPAVFYDHGGKRLVLTWYTGATGRTGVWSATSEDNGQSWSAPLRLSSQVVRTGAAIVSIPGGDDSRGSAWANARAVQLAHIDDSNAVAVTDPMPGKPLVASSVHGAQPNCHSVWYNPNLLPGRYRT